MSSRYNCNAFAEEEAVNPIAELRQKEEAAAAARAVIVLEAKNWPPFFPIIHHDIANEIPVHLQKLQYAAFTEFLGLFACHLWNIIALTIAWIRDGGILPTIDLIGDDVPVGIFYFAGFGLFCLESVLSILVIVSIYVFLWKS